MPTEDRIADIPCAAEKGRGEKVLYVAVSTGHLSVFHVPHIRLLRSWGYQVDVAAGSSPGFNFSEYDAFYPLSFARSPFEISNVKTFVQLVRILRKTEYTLMHCHTPVAGTLSRLAALFARKRPVVLYTAHGFHFFKGAPRSNWMLWFPVEWLLTRCTDFLITINQWDVNAAGRLLRARQRRWIPGIGIDLKRFSDCSSHQRGMIRQQLGYTKHDIVLLYIAELIPRKNHAFLIAAFKKMREHNSNIKLLLAGDGPLTDQVRQWCDTRGLGDAVQLLGFRNDIPDLVCMADIGVSTSKHEGLPIGIAEAIAGGLPVVVSMDRGHCELVRHGSNGFVFDQGNEDAFVRHVTRLADDEVLRTSMGDMGREYVRMFGVEASLSAMSSVYQDAFALAYKKRVRKR